MVIGDLSLSLIHELLNFLSPVQLQKGVREWLWLVLDTQPGSVPDRCPLVCARLEYLYDVVGLPRFTDQVITDARFKKNTQW